jgi:hypothetical protein
MNDNMRGTRRTRRVWLLTCLAGAVLLMTACGASGSSDSSSTISAQTTTYQKLLAFSACMRSHSVLNFPDPNANGTLTLPSGANAINLNSAPVKSAIQTCRKIFPNGGVLDPALQQKILTALLKFSQCMRGRGVTEFPDPELVNGKVSLSLTGSGIDTSSTVFVNAAKACEPIVRALQASAASGTS